MEDRLPFPALLAQFCLEVRESALKRFGQVDPEDRGWPTRRDLLTFADVLRHLIDADRWLFGQLDSTEGSPGVVIAPRQADPDQWDTMLEDFRRLGPERAHRIAALPPGDFASRTFNLGPRGIVSLSSLILRCNLDHEIHHRGGVQLALRLRYG